MPFSGVIYGHQLQLTIGEAIDDLELVAKAATAEELTNQVLFLAGWQLDDFWEWPVRERLPDQTDARPEPDDHRTLLVTPPGSSRMPPS